MENKHTIAHYVIGAAAIAIASYGVVEKPKAPPAPAGLYETHKPARFDWQSLGEKKTIALGEMLEGKPPGQVTIFCSVMSCHSLAADLDDAFQIAGWKSDSEERPVDSETDAGLSVGPPGQDAENLADALEKVLGKRPAIVGIDNLQGVGIIIGKVGK